MGNMPMRESLVCQSLSAGAFVSITAIIRRGGKYAYIRMVSLRGFQRTFAFACVSLGVHTVAEWHFLPQIRESWGSRDGAKAGRESRSAAGGSTGPLPPGAVANRFPTLLSTCGVSL